MMTQLVLHERPQTRPTYRLTRGDFLKPAEVITSEPEPKIVRWVKVADLPKDLALLESVFGEPDDTVSLRQKIASSTLLKNADVLEIGTGSGLISLCCLQAGAARVVATDLNPAAVRNALLNAREMGFMDRFEARLVPRRSPGAWTVMEPAARFDLIISNPSWENKSPGQRGAVCTVRSKLRPAEVTRHGNSGTPKTGRSHVAGLWLCNRHSSDSGSRRGREASVPTAGRTVARHIARTFSARHADRNHCGLITPCVRSNVC